MNILIYFILGLLTSLLFPPYFFLPLGFVIFPTICFLLDNNKIVSKLKIFLNYFTFSFAFFLSFLFWIKNPFFVYNSTSNIFFISIILIILLAFLFSSVLTLIISYNKIVPIYVIIPLTFTIIEYLISIIFYGFPWYNFALVLSSNSYLLIIIKLLGTLVTSYIVIQIFCLPYIFLIKKFYKLELIIFFSIIFLPLTIIFLNNIIFSKSNKKIYESKYDVEIFQLNFKVDKLLFSKEKNIEKIIDHIKNSEAEILIFAENNYPFIVNKSRIEKIQSIMKKNQNIIIGGTRKNNENYFNSMLHITSSNISYFDKKILVPFGEFLPLRNLFSFFEPISGSFDFSKGREKRLIILDSDLSFIPIICYEIAFYWKLINNINYDSNLIINITNDIWFGKYLGPFQHFYLTKMRAAEFNKTIIRVSNNGISGIFDNKGRILLNIPLNTHKNEKLEIKLENNKNFYKTHNILRLYFFSICLLLFLFNFKKNNAS